MNDLAASKTYAAINRRSDPRPVRDGRGDTAPRDVATLSTKLVTVYRAVEAP